MPHESLLAQTAALKSAAWARVRETPQYKEYEAIKKAYETLESLQAGGGALAQNRNRLVNRIRPVSAGQIVPRRVSQAEAAEAALKTAGRPMSTVELLRAMPSEGVTVGGENPEINLASSLSRSDTIQSVRIDGAAKWWLASRLPELPLKTAADQ